MKHKLSPQSRQLLSELEHGTGHLLITGRAGTGKSTLLQQFRLHTKIPLVVLAPTGVAAVHIGGETIHAFFRFAPSVTSREAKNDAYFCEDRSLYQQLEMIIIDEISMVRSDLLDCVDIFLRHVREDARPFGGVRMVFFGDLYQLPPVVTKDERETFRSRYESEWFFDAEVMRTLLVGGDTHFAVRHLDTIYRQTDPEFIRLLEAVRRQHLTASDLAALNARVALPTDESAITLTSRRDTAAAINAAHLSALPGTARLYSASRTGSVPDSHLPTLEQLELKVSARVMFVANDPDGRFVNGTLGTIISLADGRVGVRIDGGQLETVTPYTWELSHTVLSDTQELEKEKIGEFTQLPLMLAWAVTIHKAQGKTFDRVVIDLGEGAFAHGQVYVALSRARTLTGISLSTPIRERDVRRALQIERFFAELILRESDALQSQEEKYQRLQDAIEMGTTLTLRYLTPDGEQTSSVITPIAIQPLTSQGRTEVGVRALVAGTPITYLASRILSVA